MKTQQMTKKSRLTFTRAFVGALLLAVSSLVSAGSDYSARPNDSNNSNNHSRDRQNSNAPNRNIQTSLQTHASSAKSKQNATQAADQYTSSHPAKSSNATNRRVVNRNIRTPYQIARDHPINNSPNPKKRDREEKLRNVVEKPNLPFKQQKYILNRYNRIDNRLIEIRDAQARTQKKSKINN